MRISNQLFDISCPVDSIFDWKVETMHTASAIFSDCDLSPQGNDPVILINLQHVVVGWLIVRLVLPVVDCSYECPSHSEVTNHYALSKEL